MKNALLELPIWFHEISMFHIDFDLVLVLSQCSVFQLIRILNCLQLYYYTKKSASKCNN